MTEPERWTHHTHVYAFRIVYLGAPESQHRWDGDPHGEYFDADAIAREATRLQAQKARQDGGAKRRSEAKDPRDDPHVIEQRRQWSRLKGCPNFDAALDAMWADAEANKHPTTGQPDAIGALRRSGFLGFCADYRERVIHGKRPLQPLTARDLGVSSVQQSAAPRSPFASYPEEPT